MKSGFYYHWYCSQGCPGGTEWVDDQPESDEERTGLDCNRNTVSKTRTFQISIRVLPQYASELWEAYAGVDTAARKADRRGFERWIGKGCRAVSQRIEWR